MSDMAYLSFETAAGSPVVIEVDAGEIEPEPGLVKAGVGNRLRNAAATARESLDDALTAIVGANTQAFLRAVDAMPEPPDEVEISFGIKATGELSNLAIGKLGGEANYAVRITWHRSQGGSSSSRARATEAARAPS